MPFAGGNGSMGSPFLISNLDNLKYWNDNYIANHESWTVAYYLLTADIDASATSTWNSGAGWLPIGFDWGYEFDGNFDGGGHTISNIYINSTEVTNYQYTGFFGVLGDGYSIPAISRLGIANINVNHSGSSYEMHVGGLAGYLYAGSVSECYSTGTITESNTGTYIGGLAGRIGSCAIQNCYSRCTIQTSGADPWISYAGGFFDNNIAGGTVVNCYTASILNGVINTKNGFSRGSVSNTNCFWDSTIGPPTSNAGTAKTTEQLKTPSTFISVGWNTSTWALASGSYPTLLNVPEPSSGNYGANVQAVKSNLTGNVIVPVITHVVNITVSGAKALASLNAIYPATGISKPVDAPTVYGNLTAIAGIIGAGLTIQGTRSEGSLSAYVASVSIFGNADLIIQAVRANLAGSTLAGIIFAQRNPIVMASLAQASSYSLAAQVSFSSDVTIIAQVAALNASINSITLSNEITIITPIINLSAWCNPGVIEASRNISINSIVSIGVNAAIPGEVWDGIVHGGSKRKDSDIMWGLVR